MSRDAAARVASAADAAPADADAALKEADADAAPADADAAPPNAGAAPPNAGAAPPNADGALKDADADGALKDADADGALKDADADADAAPADADAAPADADAGIGAGDAGVELADADIELTDAERELVAAEVAALLPALGGRRRAGYEALADAVDAGRVPADLVGHLESLLQLALPTARARTLYRAEGEKTLTGLYRRTPAGRELGGQLSDINRALAAVAGQELRSARVAVRTLGHFTVTLRTATATITLAIRPDGMNVDSVEVAGR